MVFYEKEDEAAAGDARDRGAGKLCETRAPKLQKNSLSANGERRVYHCGRNSPRLPQCAAGS